MLCIEMRVSTILLNKVVVQPVMTYTLVLGL